MRVTFSDVFLRSLKPKAARFTVTDKHTRGLALRVSPSGEKVFVLFFRAPQRIEKPNGRVFVVRTGRTRMKTLGPFGTKQNELTLADARREAAAILARRQLGEDPQAEHIEARVEAKRRAFTFAELVGRFIDAREPNLAPATLREYRRMLTAYIESDTMGKTEADRVQRRVLRTFLDDVAANRGPAQANRLFQLVRAACRWGFADEIIATNPAAGLKRPRKETSRDRVLSDKELLCLWRALDSQPAEVSAHVRCLLLLATRATETALMRWEDLALDPAPPLSATWTVPASHRKGERSVVVPLPRQVVAMLRSLRQTGAAFGSRVFAGVSPDNAERNWWGSVRDAAMRAGAEDFTRHDLRRTCATGCARLGAPPHVVSRILGHRHAEGTLPVTEVYARHAYLAEKHEALQRWADYVERLVTEKPAPAVEIATRRKARSKRGARA